MIIINRILLKPFFFRGLHKIINTSVLVNNMLTSRLNSVYFSSSNNNYTLPDSVFVPVVYYVNIDIQKTVIIDDNGNKIVIYRLINLLTGKTYIGSSGNLSDRFRQYFNVNFLEREVVRNNTHIYKFLIKNDYSNFAL